VTPEQRAPLIARYAEGPDVLRAAWDEVPAAARQWSPAPDAWSAHQIMIHCADSETFAATRIRLLTAESTPVVVGYDQEEWVRTFSYHARSVDLAFAVVAAVRALTSSLLTTFDDAAWSRTGTHSESGPYSAIDWLVTYAAHLHDHADQIRSNVRQWQETQ
jgi:hypothetical protein